MPVDYLEEAKAFLKKYPSAKFDAYYFAIIIQQCPFVKQKIT